MFLSLLCNNHFRISESDECRMTISSLAIVFGPTVVGYSEAEPDHMLMLKETKDQAKVWCELSLYWFYKSETFPTSQVFYLSHNTCYDFPNIRWKSTWQCAIIKTKIPYNMDQQGFLQHWEHVHNVILVVSAMFALCTNR